MRTLLFLIILATSCLASQYDSGDFDQRYITGEWVRITEVPSDIPGLYKKESKLYRIGYDNARIPDTVAHYKYPISLVVVEKSGYANYGYLFNPRGGDFDMNGSPRITYSWVELIQQSLTDITIARPTDSDFNVIADTLVIKLGNETFGLKKAR